MESMAKKIGRGKMRDKKENNTNRNAIHEKQREENRKRATTMQRTREKKSQDVEHVHDMQRND